MLVPQFHVALHGSRAVFPKLSSNFQLNPSFPKFIKMHSPQNKSEAKYSTYFPKSLIKRRNVSSPFLTSQHCLQPCIQHDELSEQQNSSIPVITNEVCLNTFLFLLFSFGLLVPVWFVQNVNIVQNSKSECLTKNITWTKLVVDGIQSDIGGFYPCD